MAQTTGEISGLQIMEITSAEDKADDLHPVAQKFLDAFHNMQRGNHKAAAAHGVDAINMIAEEFGITCGASL